MAKWNLVLLPFLAKFGIWGVGLVAMLDSSTIPVQQYVMSVWPRLRSYC